jgi:hypothetical protein
MPGNIIMINDQEGRKRKLNNSDSEINRGIELLLRNNRRKSERPKTFQMKFGKIISLLKREIHLFFEFHLDIRKIR